MKFNLENQLGIKAETVNVYVQNIKSRRRKLVSKITTSLLQEMVQAAATRLGKQAEYVNSLNVFPVPDGDTGTNMGMTMDNGAKAVADQSASTVGEVGQILSKVF